MPPLAKAPTGKAPGATPPAGAPTVAGDVKGAMAKLKTSEFQVAMTVNGKPMGVMETKGGSYRLEPPPTPREKMAYIFNASEKKVIMLMLKSKTAMEMPQMKSTDLSPAGPDTAVGKDADVDWKKSADGKYWEATSADGKRTMKIWLDGQGGLPSRLETTEGAMKNVTEWKYLKVGGIPDSDFTVPKDFKVSSMPGMPGMPKTPGKPRK